MNYNFDSFINIARASIKANKLLNITVDRVNEDASGIVMVTKEGMESAAVLLNLSKKIASLYRLPDLYYEYFKSSNKSRKDEFIFSKDWGENE